MKLMHISDLHLGKRVHGFSMQDDQKYILDQIRQIALREKPQAILIAGDVYDKSIPPAEAVVLLDSFLRDITQDGIKICMISGNHDSAERVAFGAKLMETAGLFISPVYDGSVQPIQLADEFGTVCIYPLPFLKPSNVRSKMPDREIETYTDAMRCAIEKMNIDQSQRNILLTHQFVTGAFRSESEDISVGGADNVDASVFEPFDYVALGHLHGPQSVQRPTIRYSGSPLKYSFSEKGQKKSVLLLDVREKGNMQITEIPLTPLHEMREIRGTYNEITLRENYIGTATDDYLRIILTDEKEVPEAFGKLHVIYPNLMKLDYDNTRTRSGGFGDIPAPSQTLQPAALFAEFYEKQNGKALDEAQTAFVAALFEQLQEGTK